MPRFLNGVVACFGLAVSSIVALDALKPAFANPWLTSCWRMTNDSYYSAGVGPGIKWKLLGYCQATLDKDGQVTKIQVTSPSIVLIAKPGNTHSLKPYQNPNDVWMHGIWESDAKRSAIFATERPEWGK